MEIIKFELIKEYPDSPKVGTIAQDYRILKNGGWYYPGLDWFFQYPEYWKPLYKEENYIKIKIKI